MEPQITAPASSALAVQVIFLMLFMFPDCSLMLWKTIMKKWTLAEEKMILMKRTRTADEKLKKYWEIDMRKFK